MTQVKQTRNTDELEGCETGTPDASTIDAQQEFAPKRGFSIDAIHLLRTTQVNTLTLSMMADQKANIMIGATFVVFSLSVTRLMGADLTPAILCLAVTAFLSSLCAMVAVMPGFGRSPAPDEKPNLLFFGHFADLDEEVWKARLMERLGQDEAVFDTMMHDIYQNGRVLHSRKYRFLAYGYRILLGGLCLTMLVFAGEYIAEAVSAV